MRLSKLFKLSFVGALIFTPGMAQQAEQVHNEALKVLRAGDTNRAPAAIPANETRAEREARLKAEAQQRLDDRERLQAEKRRQFDEYVKERERLRQQRQSGTTSAQSPEKVHNQASEVLRNLPAGNVTATPAPAAAPTPAATPAPAAIAESAPAAPAAVTQAPSTAQSSDDIQQRALEILRQEQSARTAPPSSPAPAAAPVRAPSAPVAPVREAELAPRVTTPQAAPAGSSQDVHQKALEVLRQQSTSAPATAPGNTTPTRTQSTSPAQDDLKPSPELQRRLDEMRRELEAEQRQSFSPNSQATEAYKKELEQRALQAAQSVPPPASTPTPSVAPAPASAPTVSATPAPAATPAAPTTARTAQPTTPAARLDPQTSEMIRRQNEQIARQSGPVYSGATAASSPALDPAAEARAREILRQQQQVHSSGSPAPTVSSAVPASPAATAPTIAQPSTQPASPAPVATSTAPAYSGGDVQYSRELEERARQSLLQRAQPAQSATVAPATTPPPAEATAAAKAASELSNSPLSDDPQLNQVHSRALDTLTQVEPGESGQTKLRSKQDRLRALTELYRADRLTPAEYHQRRAQILSEK